MDTSNRRNSNLELQIIETCKQSNTSFTQISTKQITDNVNLVFGTNYSEKEVNFVLGGLYEKQFYYTTINTNIYDI